MKTTLIISLFTVFLLIGCSQVEEITTYTDESKSMMDHMTMSDITSEKQFLEEMVPHHQEAVNSSEQLLQVAENPKLKQFLQSVVSLQNAEIEQMKAWHKEWYQSELVPASNYMPMMTDTTSMQTEAAEQAYIKDMIMHHLSAVKMANQLLALDPSRSELVQFAQAIISVQSDEITFLQSLQK
jgi:uncharacterized protein (DUF305 family)